MKIRTAAIASFAILASLIGFAANAQVNLVQGLRDVFPELQNNVRIPVLMPDYLPPESETSYVEWTATSLYSYEVILSYTPNCGGAKYCFFGLFSGSSSSEDMMMGGNPITLQNGIQAYFRNPTCGNCGDSALSWKQGQSYYLIRYKLPGSSEKEQLNTMLRIANSIR